MSKSLVVGNGTILVDMDERGQVRDLYYPHIGLENHVGGNMVHRVGVWTDNRLHWTSDPAWQIAVSSEARSLVGNTTARNQELGLELNFADLVYNEKNIFLRKVKIKNNTDRERVIKIFFGQQFEVAESYAAHTAYYDPERAVVVHYRNQRAFLINATLDGRGFDDWSAGVFASEGKEGTHVDAEDGVLSKNPIEHGQADSVIGLSQVYKPGEEKVVHYWIAVGQTIQEVDELNQYVLERGASHLVETTHDFWQAWVTRRAFNFYDLDQSIVDLFHRSLLLIRAHADSAGGILASSDSNSLQQGKDTYSYVWPRDAAFAALALGRAGDVNVARRFFRFACDVLGEREYFLHKYSPDKSLGSSWLPWLKRGVLQLPIQEDETAIIIWALWQHYQITKDLEFVEQVYNSLIKRTADFMVLYRDATTGLPKPSYDLWEEKLGVSTFTAASVYGGLTAAAKFAEVLGKIKAAETYRSAAEEVKEGIIKYLYDGKREAFYKLANFKPEEITYDPTLDISSVYGLFIFGVLPVGDKRLHEAMRHTVNRLSCREGIGGLARYEDDAYLRASPRAPGNPWFITTLWVAEYYIRRAENQSDLAPAREWLHWVTAHALPSGILSEQLHPHTGAQLSVAPLVWSHAAFIQVVIAYLDRLEELGICPGANPVY